MKNFLRLLPIVSLLTAFGFAGSIPNTPKPQTQPFWTAERKVLTGGLVAESIIDGVQTQRLLNIGRTETDPLAKPFVTHGVTGQVAACAIGVGAAVGTQYLMHKLHHERIAKWFGRMALVGEGAVVIHNTRAGD
jgi:hypothetical protein